MIDLIRDMILAAAGVLVLVVLNRANATRAPVPARVWPFLILGFLLLLCGRLMDTFPAATVGVHPVTKNLLQEVVGFLLGFTFVSIGLLRWLPEVLGRESSARRPAPQRRSVNEVKYAQELNSVQEMLTSVLKSSLSGVMILKSVRDETDEIIDFECILVNDAAQQILGRSSMNLVGRCILKEFQCIRSENLLGHMVSVIETGLPFRNERHFNHDRNGRWYQFVAVKLGDGLAVTFGDVSDRKIAEEQLRHAAHHDTLTGLPNRALFTERLAMAINRSKRFPAYRFAVLFLDFDGFKVVNDTLGHEVGDRLLVSISDRLRDNLRTIDTSSRVNDAHLPARLGGDEFVVLIDNIQDVHDAVRVAERLQGELSNPHQLAGHEVISTASIGIVSSELGYESSDDIIRDADTAMYQAKEAGKARYVVFDDRMHQEVIDRARLERELRAAVGSAAFDLVFDPIVNLESGEIAGFEALLRWPHPTRGVLTADDFLGLAEELGLVVPIGTWVLDRACACLRDWRRKFAAHESLTLNVNLSRQQLQSPELVSTIRQIFDEHSIAPGDVRLEITEAMLMNESAPSAFTVIDELEALGVHLVMDDFGSGHSSLSCLHRFPIKVLKIDRDFMHSVRRRRDYGAIVNAVVELAHNLDMDVVAEGVQTEDQLALLQALDCDYAQGTVFREPATTHEVLQMLGNGCRFGAAA